ncbi:MAG: undecaprenyl-diphosphate phosphatase [Coriobacteriia bacterium]|nr:undecaprenyl-diphosphate phosphatase [Coriobacteriia bacterium]
MGLFEVVVLAVVQAITEFLPISSDGHLILVPTLAGWERFGLGFDVALHLGTLIATVIYFRRDVAALALGLFSREPERSKDRRLAWVLLAATVPSVAVVLVLEAFVSGVESRPVNEQIVISAWGLLVTTVLLVASEAISSLEKRRQAPSDDASAISWPKALAVGFAQGFAVLPGVSRSGTTIASAQALGITRGEAARFSFLLSIPIISAATAKKLLDVATGEESMPEPMLVIVGIAVTAVVGYAVIGLLLPFVRKHSLLWFAAYTSIAGILLLAVYGPL